MYNKEIEDNYGLKSDELIKKDKQYFTCYDKDGYYYRTQRRILKNGTPIKFSSRNPYTIQNINRYCELEGNMQRLISKEYAGAHTLLST